MKQRGVPLLRDYLQGVQLRTVSLKQIDLAVRTFERLEQNADGLTTESIRKFCVSSRRSWADEKTLRDLHLALKGFERQ